MVCILHLLDVECTDDQRHTMCTSTPSFTSTRCPSSKSLSHIVFADADA